MSYRRIMYWVGLCVCGAMLAGCEFDRGSSYVASDLPAAAPRLGKTAVVIQTTGWESPAVKFDRVHDEVAGALAGVPGTTDTALPTGLLHQRLKDSELLSAARQAGAKSLCVVTVNYLGSYVSLGIGIPPYQAASHVDYDVRLFDVASGTLLIHSDRHDETYHLFEPPSHALVDLRRGMNKMLRQSGLLEASPAGAPTTRPAMVVAGLTDIGARIP